jgi:hypothetical protein
MQKEVKGTMNRQILLSKDYIGTVEREILARYNTLKEVVRTLHDILCGLRAEFSEYKFLYFENIGELVRLELKYENKVERIKAFKKLKLGKSFEKTLNFAIENIKEFYVKKEISQPLSFDDYMKVKAALDEVIERLEKVIKVLR